MAATTKKASTAKKSPAKKATKKPAAKKAAKKATKKPASASKRVVKPVRVKIVWEVCSPTGSVAAVFAYPDRVAAEAKVMALTKSTGRTHGIRGTKVPME